VEQLCAPGVARPLALPAGSPGYAHRTAAAGLWQPEGDRFAGAVLLAELLGWCDEPVREAAWGESYFAPDELQGNGEHRRTLAAALDRRWGSAVAALFQRAWDSETLADCPTFGEWLVSLRGVGCARRISVASTAECCAESAGRRGGTGARRRPFGGRWRVTSGQFP